MIRAVSPRVTRGDIQAHQPPRMEEQMDSVLEVLQEANGLTGPLAITRVAIRRAEGPIALCDGWHLFEGVNAEERGNTYLREISQTAPKESGYDKTDVKLTFANGQEWNARFDIKHSSQPDNDTNLRQHVSDFLYFHLNPGKIQWIRDLAVSSSEYKRREAVSHIVSIRKMFVEDAPAFAELLALIDPDRK